VVFVHVCHHTGFESGVIDGVFGHGCGCCSADGLRRKMWRWRERRENGGRCRYNSAYVREHDENRVTNRGQCDSSYFFLLPYFSHFAC